MKFSSKKQYNITTQCTAKMCQLNYYDTTILQNPGSVPDVQLTYTPF